jgi:hypothetical protein
MGFDGVLFDCDSQFGGLIGGEPDPPTGLFGGRTIGGVLPGFAPEAAADEELPPFPLPLDLPLSFELPPGFVGFPDG